MKKRLSLLLVVILLLTNTMGVSAKNHEDNDNNYGFETYLEDNSFAIKSNNDKNNGVLNSDDYIRLLLREGIEFEVKDTYYTLADSESSYGYEISEIETIDGLNYVKTNEIITKNQLPESNLTVNYVTPSDVRLREVVESDYRIKVDSKSGIYSVLASTTAIVLIGLKFTLAAAILSFADALYIPYDNIGYTTVDIWNYYRPVSVWHEVYDVVGYIPMVIIETRRTNVKYEYTMVDEDTSQLSASSSVYNGVMYEYGLYFNELTRNLNEAAARYNAGLRNPQIYLYNTGLVIDNSSMLPQ